MINENTYIVGMWVISWMVAIFMGMGCIAVTSIKSDADNENTEDHKRLMYEAFMNQFYSMTFSEKVVNVIYFGALIWAKTFVDLVKLLLKLIKRRNKE